MATQLWELYIGVLFRCPYPLDSKMPNMTLMYHRRSWLWVWYESCSHEADFVCLGDGRVLCTFHTYRYVHGIYLKCFLSKLRRSIIYSKCILGYVTSLLFSACHFSHTIFSILRTFLFRFQIWAPGSLLCHIRIYIRGFSIWVTV